MYCEDKTFIDPGSLNKTSAHTHDWLLFYWLRPPDSYFSCSFTAYAQEPHIFFLLPSVKTVNVLNKYMAKCNIFFGSVEFFYFNFIGCVKLR